MSQSKRNTKDTEMSTLCASMRNARKLKEARQKAHRRKQLAETMRKKLQAAKTSMSPLYG